VHEGNQVRFHFVLIDFWAELKGGILTPNHECLAVQWISRDNLPTYDLTDGARKAIEKVFHLMELRKISEKESLHDPPT
jgi:hypothetical protein